MKAVRHWAKQLGSGYLAIDDVVVAKPFCWLNPWIGWTYCNDLDSDLTAIVLRKSCN